MPSAGHEERRRVRRRVEPLDRLPVAEEDAEHGEEHADVPEHAGEVEESSGRSARRATAGTSCHRHAATVASDAQPMPTAWRCAIRTRPKVSSALPVRKYGLCSLIEAMSASSEPISSQNDAARREGQHRPAARRVDGGTLGRGLHAGFGDGRGGHRSNLKQSWSSEP